jgi:hypothetical protein
MSRHYHILDLSKISKGFLALCDVYIYIYIYICISWMRIGKTTYVVYVI